jgi:hypothetical protein
MPTPVEDVDLTRLPGWDALPPDVQQVFAGVRLPAAFMAGTWVDFTPGPEFGVDGTSTERRVRFGECRTGQGGTYVVDVTTGNVLLWQPGIDPGFVSSSLSALAATLHVIGVREQVIRTGDAAACEEAASDIRAEISDLDDAAIDPYGHWGQFLADVEGGDFSDNPDF